MRVAQVLVVCLAIAPGVLAHTSIDSETNGFAVSWNQALQQGRQIAIQESGNLDILEYFYCLEFNRMRWEEFASYSGWNQEKTVFTVNILGILPPESGGSEIERNSDSLDEVQGEYLLSLSPVAAIGDCNGATGELSRELR